jgi:hypothetical protein
MTTLITDKLGVSYGLTSAGLSPGLTVYHVALDGVPVARAVLNIRRGCIQDVVVYSVDDRRRGIASALYDAIEEDQRLKLVPNHRRLSDGKAFWRSRQGRTERKALGRMATRYAHVASSSSAKAD